MKSASVKRFIASILILSQFAGVLRAQTFAAPVTLTPNQAFTQGKDLATQSRFKTGDDIAAGKPGGIPLTALVPDANTGLRQSSLTTPEEVKQAAKAFGQ